MAEQEATEVDAAFREWWDSNDVPPCTNPDARPRDYEDIARAAWERGRRAQRDTLLEALKRIKGGFDDDSEGAAAPSADGYWPLWTRVPHDGLPSVRDGISAAIAEAEAQP
jgi:hypothetical protein